MQPRGSNQNNMILRRNAKTVQNLDQRSDGSPRQNCSSVRTVHKRAEVVRAAISFRPLQQMLPISRCSRTVPATALVDNRMVGYA